MNIIISLLLLTIGLVNAILANACGNTDTIEFTINNKYSIKIQGLWFFGIHSIINIFAGVYVWSLNV